MNILLLKDKSLLRRFLSQDPTLHLYGLGDLDDFFWKDTAWYGLGTRRCLRAVVLIYQPGRQAILLALSDHKRLPFLKRLVHAILPLLPGKFYAHLTPGIEGILTRRYRLRGHGTYHKMALKDRSKVQRADDPLTVEFTPKDAKRLKFFYDRFAPGNWFEPRMLQAHPHYGVVQKGRIVSAAGVHVYSRRYGVAALGNVVTARAWRGRGYATLAVARLCRELLRKVRIIGLNTRIDNRPALACYRRLGFRPVTVYKEYDAIPKERKGRGPS